MTAQIIPFEDLDRDVRTFARSLLSPDDTVWTCLIEDDYPRHPIILTKQVILKFVLHMVPNLLAAEVIPWLKVKRVVVEEYRTKAEITVYHRGVIVVDNQGQRYVEAITSQGIVPMMRPLEPFSNADPLDGYDLIGFFALPDEESEFQRWASSVDRRSKVPVEWRR